MEVVSVIQNQKHLHLRRGLLVVTVHGMQKVDGAGHPVRAEADVRHAELDIEQQT